MLNRLIKVISVPIAFLGSPVWLVILSISYIFTGFGPGAAGSAYLEWLCD